MTSDKRVKTRIRARMAKTGERYTTARHHYVDAPPGRQRSFGYELRGGLHPDTAAIANVLAHAGMTGPDGAPLSESLVLGVMGGLGAGYILWEFAHDDSRIVTVGFRNRCQYRDALCAAFDRLRVPYNRHETGGTKGAARRLEAALDNGRPVLVWPDRYHVGYWHLPSQLDGHGGHPVVVYAQRDDRVYLDDRTLAPLSVSSDDLSRARARVGSYKHGLVEPQPEPGALDRDQLRIAVLEGIDDCVSQMSGSSSSFSLPAWRKWARLMTDRRHAKGWPSVFSDGVGLIGALLSVWEGASPAGMTGGSLRDLYADFLGEAQGLLEADLQRAIDPLRRAAHTWTELGDVALDHGNPEFATLRELTITIREAIVAEGDDGRSEAAAAGEELWRRRVALDAACPLSSDEVEQLFERMGQTLKRIFELESAAVYELGASMRKLH